MICLLSEKNYPGLPGPMWKSNGPLSGCATLGSMNCNQAFAVTGHCFNSATFEGFQYNLFKVMSRQLQSL